MSTTLTTPLDTAAAAVDAGSSPSTPTTPSSSSSSSIIIGAVAAGVIVVVLGVIGLIVYRRRRQLNHNGRRPSATVEARGFFGRNTHRDSGNPFMTQKGSHHHVIGGAAPPPGWGGVVGPAPGGPKDGTLTGKATSKAAASGRRLSRLVVGPPHVQAHDQASLVSAVSSYTGTTLTAGVTSPHTLVVSLRGLSSLFTLLLTNLVNPQASGTSPMSPPPFNKTDQLSPRQMSPASPSQPAATTSPTIPQRVHHFGAGAAVSTPSASSSLLTITPPPRHHNLSALTSPNPASPSGNRPRNISQPHRPTFLAADAMHHYPPSSPTPLSPNTHTNRPRNHSQPQPYTGGATWTSSDAVPKLPTLTVPLVPPPRSASAALSPLPPPSNGTRTPATPSTAVVYPPSASQLAYALATHTQDNTKPDSVAGSPRLPFAGGSPKLPFAGGSPRLPFAGGSPRLAFADATSPVAVAKPTPPPPNPFEDPVPIPQPPTADDDEVILFEDDDELDDLDDLDATTPGLTRKPSALHRSQTAARFLARMRHATPVPTSGRSPSVDTADASDIYDDEGAAGGRWGRRALSTVTDATDLSWEEGEGEGVAWGGVVRRKSSVRRPSAKQ
ncbi:hypothetical protein HDU96_009222 [Phlyctochytrium bullatum]|nr:hypothetical protein HDU96_009222 [Phlyctochytrium bullatum]